MAERCYNYSCPFKKVSSNECECTACPNRCVNSTYYTSNRTLTKEELKERFCKAHFCQTCPIFEECDDDFLPRKACERAISEIKKME